MRKQGTGELSMEGHQLDRDRPLFAFFGHHKAGTRWIGLILETLANSLGLRWECVSNPKWFGHDLQAYVENKGIDVLSFSNADRRYVEKLRGFRGFHVVRDPRDMVVSAYFSHLASHRTEYWPELVPHRERLARLSRSDGLLLDIEFTTRLPTDGYELRPFQAMAEWDYKRAETLEMRFEDLIANPVEAFAAVVDHLGLPVNGLATERAVAANGFEVLSGGRRPGEEDAASHYRLGVPGDWRRYLKQSHLELLEERNGDIATLLGYEHRRRPLGQQPPGGS